MIQRAIPSSLRRVLDLQESGEALIGFLTISHASLAASIRVASDGVDYVWLGETWIGFPFKFAILSDGEAGPRTQIEVQNVDRKIGDALRSITTPARVQIDILAASEFDETADPRTARGTPLVAYSAKHLFLTNVKVDPLVVTGDVVSWDYTQDTWPGRRATQDRCPALYR
ncbi:hypothetical protein [Xanthobacter sp.]|uniref:hypothetical protein n=1 Tax=Xanthobacter sp. TaxID=35809 RepID=UPI0025FA4ABD|nr:hypothetical protein [Xanthobacter sp.]